MSTKNDNGNMPTNKQKGKKTCSACGVSKNLTDFYVSYSPMYATDGRIPICKDCCKTTALNNDGTINYSAFKQLLLHTDKPLYYDLLHSAYETVRKQNSYISDTEVEFHGGSVLQRYYTSIAMKQDRATSYADAEKEGHMHTSSNRSIEEKTQILNKYKPLFEGLNISSQITTKEIYKQTQVTQQKQEETVIYNEFWMGDYSQRDIDILDKYYAGLNRDYKIVTENHKDYAKKIAKASLMMDKAYEDMLRGVTGADKMYASAKDIFDSLSKSAKFSEDKRSINDVGISSFSKITSIVENHNWIPQHVPKEKDMYDEMLEALSVINESI